MSTRVWPGIGASFVSQYWWVMVLRGVIAILFGIAIIARPGVTATVLALLFGAFVFVTGALAIIAALSIAGSYRYWWAILIEGLLGIAAGLIAFLWPGITVVALLAVIAAWAFITGVFQIIGAIKHVGPPAAKWLQGLSGVLSIVLAVLLVMWPVAGVVAMVWLLGIYAIALGINQIIHGIRQQRLHRWLEART